MPSKKVIFHFPFVIILHYIPSTTVAKCTHSLSLVIRRLFASLAYLNVHEEEGIYMYNEKCFVRIHVELLLSGEIFTFLSRINDRHEK